MNISQEYFLLVAQELNISHAAQKLAISQQGLSSHIRRLEESYGVKLFQRTPKLRLTAAGEKLVRALNRIKLIESGLAVELAQDTGSESGIVRIGLHPSRAFLLAPLVLPVFQKSFRLCESTLKTAQHGNLSDAFSLESLTALSASILFAIPSFRSCRWQRSAFTR